MKSSYVEKNKFKRTKYKISREFKNYFQPVLIFLLLLCFNQQKLIMKTLQALKSRFFLLFVLFSLPVPDALAMEGGIRNFEVRENLIKNDKLAIIALDTLGNPQESINGTFQFKINGFKQELQFRDGVGITPHAIESSTFVFIKHQNQSGSQGKLYYVMKSSKGINPMYINWYYLILIPLAIILLGYLFKRLIVVAILLLVGLFLFNYSKGLNLESLFDTIVHGIRGMVGY